MNKKREYTHPSSQVVELVCENYCNSTSGNFFTGSHEGFTDMDGAMGGSHEGFVDL